MHHRQSLLSYETLVEPKNQREDGRASIQVLAFPNAAGEFRHSSKFTRREWRVARHEAELPDITFHGLRHYSHYRPLLRQVELQSQGDARSA